MRLALCPVLVSLVAAVTLTGAHGVVFRSVMSAPQRWIHQKSPAFGLVQRLSRGGANTEDVDHESSREEGEPVELYLPGLLEASISKTKKVRLWLLSC